MSSPTGRSLVRSLAPLALLSLLTAAPALADTKSCVAAHASAQRETKAGHLTEAAKLYTSCGSDLSCPEQLRSECAELLDKLRATVPSIILSAKDENGADVTAVKVYSGETRISDGLDGRALELDPGKYHLRFVLPSGLELTSDVLVREGEKNRLVEVKAPEKAKPVAPASPPTAVAPALPPPVAHSGPPLAAWVATGFAVAGLGTFGTFALLGKSDKQKLDDCAPACPASEHARRDSLKTKYLVADVGLGVGAASAVLATVLFVTSGGSSSQDTAGKLEQRRVDVAAGPHGAQLLWRGRF